MKKITVYILLLLLLSSICSCLDDKNNYDYTPINELKGTISNIEKNYSVGIDEDLVISKRLRDSILSPFFHSYIFAMYKNEALWI